MDLLGFGLPWRLDGFPGPGRGRFLLPLDLGKGGPSAVISLAGPCLPKAGWVGLDILGTPCCAREGLL